MRQDKAARRRQALQKPVLETPAPETKEVVMSELGPDAGFWGARIAGAFAGSAISLIYLLPEGRREAAGRLVTGVTTGLIFGGPTGLWLARKLDLANDLSGSDVMLAGSALASLCAWWALGILARVATRWGGGRG